MTQENFIYWLNGFLEISDAKKLNEKQVQIIKDHLALVFEKQTPDRTSFGIDAQEQINKILGTSPGTGSINNIPNTLTTQPLPKGICSSGHRNNGKSTVYC